MSKKKFKIFEFSSKEKEGCLKKKKTDHIITDVGYEKTDEDIERISKKRSRIMMLGTGGNTSSHSQSSEDIIRLGWIVDRISYLPEEIKLNILSLMPTRDAARTPVLSKQWLHLWTRVWRLDFDFDCSKEISRRRKSFVNQVSQAMKSVGGEGGASCWDKFRVSLDMGCHAVKLDKWVSTAFEKKVQILDLNLTTSSPKSYYRSPKVTSYELLPPPMGVLDIHCCRLKSLRLQAVRVSGETLECFMHNCKNLEELSVRASDTLISLRVGGGTAPVSVKKLEIIYCNGLKQLEIQKEASNLSCFKLLTSDTSSKCILEIGDELPSLANICISGAEFVLFLADRYVPDTLLYNSRSSRSSTAILTQLQKLTLELKFPYVHVGHISMSPIASLLHLMQLPPLSSLKQLCFIINNPDTYVFLEYKSLLVDSCPLLQQLKLELSMRNICSFSRYRSSYTKKSNFENVKLQHLKEIIIIGWAGSQEDPLLIIDLVAMAGNLKKFTIDVRDPGWLADCPGDYSSSWGCRYNEFEIPERLWRARLFAEKMIPVGVEVEVLPHDY